MKVRKPKRKITKADAERIMREALAPPDRKSAAAGKD